MHFSSSLQEKREQLFYRLILVLLQNYSSIGLRKEPGKVRGRKKEMLSASNRQKEAHYQAFLSLS